MVCQPVFIDVFLSGKLNDFTRSRIQNLIENGHVLVQGAPAAKNCRLRPGDTVCASIPPPVEPDILPEDMGDSLVDGYAYYREKDIGNDLFGADRTDDVIGGITQYGQDKFHSAFAEEEETVFGD